MSKHFIQEDKYVGKQILIDSDRLVFNSRDDVVFSSKNRFLYKTDGDLHFNIREDIFIINKPESKIHLGYVQKDGTKKLYPNIPAVRSKELNETLIDLIEVLILWLNFEYPLTAGVEGGGADAESNVRLTDNIIPELARIVESLKSGYIESKNIFLI